MYFFDISTSKSSVNVWGFVHVDFQIYFVPQRRVFFPLQLHLRLHNYTPLHEISLHYTTLHYTTFHYIPLHYTTLHYTTLR